jgi:hypothetical protein
MEKESLREKFFPPLDWDGWHLSRGGYLPFIVSFFDSLMSHEDLEKVDFSPIHKKAEENFVSFYGRLMTEGAYVNTGNLISFLPEMNKEFSDIIVRSMRGWKLFAAYFPAYKVRVQSRFDLSDILLLREEKTLPQLKKVAEESGLFVLPAPHLM